MDNIIKSELTSEETAQLQHTIAQYCAEIEQMRERMRRSQAEIDASGARADATLNRIQERLAQLQAS